MLILDLNSLPGRHITHFDSEALTIAPLGMSGRARFATAELGPDGAIGRHPAAGMQMLVVIRGEAIVSGSDREPHVLGPGQAAIWQPDEEHETRTESGLLALIVEGEIDLQSAFG